MQHVKLSGAPFNLGVQHGRQLASLIPSAIEFYCQFPKGSEEKVLAAASSDEVVIVENYPTARGVQRSSDEPIVRTNHCLCPEAIPSMANEQVYALYGYPDLPENSRARYENATRLAVESGGAVPAVEYLIC